MTKRELRKIFAERRQNLSALQVAKQSEAIAQRFFSAFDVENTKAIHCFLPIRQKNEVDVFRLIYPIREHFLKTQVVVPRVVTDTQQLEHYLWTSHIKLQINRWGILEPDPTSCLQHPLSNVQIVIVPLLIFDRKGHRVGYGQGFYDRFLVNLPLDVKKVGVSFFEPVEKISDTDPFDVRLDYCLTPQRIWKF